MENTDRPNILAIEKRANGKLTQINFTELHVQVLQFIARTGWARDIQIAGWLGASYTTVTKALTYLKKAKLVKSEKTYAKLRDFDSDNFSERQVTVWSITSRAMHEEIIGSWRVAGYGEDELCTATPGSINNLSQIDHRLCINDIAIIFARYGFEIAFEKDIKQLDGVGYARSKRLSKVWIVGNGTHTPDLGIINPKDGRKWGVEIERRQKETESYEVVISRFSNSGMGQLWFCQRPAIARAILRACEKRGITMTEFEFEYGSVWVSSDGLIRISIYRGGVVTPMPAAYPDCTDRRRIFWDVAAGLPVECISQNEKGSVWRLPLGHKPPMGFPPTSPIDRAKTWNKRKN